MREPSQAASNVEKQMHDPISGEQCNIDIANHKMMVWMATLPGSRSGQPMTYENAQAGKRVEILVIFIDSFTLLVDLTLDLFVFLSPWALGFSPEPRGNHVVNTKQP